MELTDTQKQSIAQWVKEGSGLSDIQKKITAEFGIPMTYMDVRLLVLDLGLKLQEKFKPAAVQPAIGDTGSAGHESAAAGLTNRGQAPAGGAGAVTVALDRVTVPGAIVSGTVRFSDGVTASWHLDQFGRLALKAAKPGYTPSQQDVQMFQKELSNAMAKMGY